MPSIPAQEMPYSTSPHRHPQFGLNGFTVNGFSEYNETSFQPLFGKDSFTSPINEDDDYDEEFETRYGAHLDYLSQLSPSSSCESLGTMDSTSRIVASMQPQNTPSSYTYGYNSSGSLANVNGETGAGAGPIYFTSWDNGESLPPVMLDFRDPFSPNETGAISDPFSHPPASNHMPRGHSLPTQRTTEWATPPSNTPPISNSRAMEGLFNNAFRRFASLFDRRSESQGPIIGNNISTPILVSSSNPRVSAPARLIESPATDPFRQVPGDDPPFPRNLSADYALLLHSTSRAAQNRRRSPSIPVSPLVSS